MRIPLGRSAAVSLLLAFVAWPLFAATYAIPSDRDLIRDATAIVIATSHAAHAQFAAAGRIVTVSELRIEDSIKGEIQPGTLLRLTEPGGVVGDLMLSIAGVPRYEPGERYLVFLRADRVGVLGTLDLGLGRFVIQRDLDGREFAQRFESDADAISDTSGVRGAARDLRRFEQFIRNVVRGAEAEADYFIPPTPWMAEARRAAALAKRSDYLMSTSGSYARWQNPITVFLTRGTQPGFANGGLTAAADGTSTWSSAGGAVNYSVGGTTAASGGLSTSDGVSSIQFNDPNGFVAARCASGCVAIGGFWALGTHSIDGETFFSIVEADVEMGPSDSRMSENDFRGILTHEIGHTLGFRHSNLSADNQSACAAPLPCADIGAALMASTYLGGMGATLRQWDRDAVTTVYPASKATRRRAVAK